MPFTRVCESACLKSWTHNEERADAVDDATVCQIMKLGRRPDTVPSSVFKYNIQPVLRPFKATTKTIMSRLCFLVVKQSVQHQLQSQHSHTWSAWIYLACRIGWSKSNSSHSKSLEVRIPPLQKQQHAKLETDRWQWYVLKCCGYNALARDVGAHCFIELIIWSDSKICPDSWSQPLARGLLCLKSIVAI